MKPLHYIIFHPDYAREKTLVQAQVLIKHKPELWKGYVWVDEPEGNEDPYVFSERWIYSYCHATQLKRKPNPNTPYVKEGSYLFFCSGDAANRCILQLDTVFVVDHVAEWPDNHQGLPDEFMEHYRNNISELWRRHFKYPFHGFHRGRYTYISKHWFDEEEMYSFLPISETGQRVAFELSSLQPSLRRKIEAKVYGKYPVPLSENEKEGILQLTLSETSIQVVGEVARENPSSNLTLGCSEIEAGSC